MKGDFVVLKNVFVSRLFGIGSTQWKADSTQPRAAWSLYVEMVILIAVQSLEID